MTEKVFREFLARLEEASVYFQIHKSDVWSKELEKSRESLLNVFKEQQKEIERLEKRMETAIFTDVDYEPKPKRTFKLK